MQDWIIFLLGLLLAIPLSVLANIATPRIKTWYDQSAFSSRKKRIESLTIEYFNNKWLNENPSLLVATTIGMILIIVLGVSAFAIFIGVLILTVYILATNEASVFAGIVGLIGLGILSLALFTRIFRLHTDSLHFDQYRKRTIEKIIRLGGNPEDLDKEEPEGG